MGSYRKIKTKGKRVKASLLQRWYRALQRYGLNCRYTYIKTWTS